MRSIRIAQQIATSKYGGGLKTEFNSLMKSELAQEYCFIPVELKNCHSGISIADIWFYFCSFKEADADIVHIRGAGIESLNAVLAAKLLHKGKIFVAVHGMFSDLAYYPAVKRWICKNVIERLIFKMADGISCVCKTASYRMVFDDFRNKMLPIVYNRMPDWNPIGADDRVELRSELGFFQDDVIGVYIGRITKEKGLEYLVEALKVLDNDWPKNFVFIVVGDGEYLSTMEKKCSLLNHASSVRFAGQVEHVNRLLNVADFFLSPSLHENCSISVLEACAAGLPCLVSNVGGNPEIVKHGINGFLIPPRSSYAICEGIRNMCSPCTRYCLKQQMEKISYDTFSNSHIDKQLKTVYQQLLSEEGEKNGKHHYSCS